MDRAVPGNLDVVFTGRWSSHYVYGTDHPPDAVESENYFLPLAHFFVDADGNWTPDRIEVVTRTDGGFLVAEFILSAASARHVQLERISDWRAVGAAADSTPAAPRRRRTKTT